ncbi:MAG: A/G-specific adenine glycosylase, partial [Terriglobales bacterium]
MHEREKRKLRTRLLAWYGRHGRDLPWRRTRNPYRIWVSEIMLQQTRVPAVLRHYHEFLRRFPSVQRLAAARPESVLAAWSGLGYYRRARSLHAAARVIVRERSGRFPHRAQDWRALPGVGRYTAAAIASIAFDEPVAVVDGNVERVLSRLPGGRRRLAASAIWESAGALLSRSRPGDFNQAMMELGATVCLPQAPKCGECPLASWCKARGAVERAAKAPRQRRSVAYGLSTRDDTV